MTKLVLFSDTHGYHEKIVVPDGDFLIFAGDMCGGSKPRSLSEVQSFLSWMSAQPHRHKILIAGNHDWAFELEAHLINVPDNLHYLQDSGLELGGLKIWGSPVQPMFYRWAFNRERGSDIRKHWDLIPDDIDILITHGPPLGILDHVAHGNPVGCRDLLKAVVEINPRVHVFGHIHEGYGQQTLDDTIFVNACICDRDYSPVNSPIVVSLP